MKRRTIFTAAVIAAMLALSGCNNSENPTQSEQSTVETQSSSDETSTESASSAVTSSTTENSTSTESGTESSTESDQSVPVDEKPVSAYDLGLQDGIYYVNVTLEGGSGKTKVKSPAEMEVYEGNAYATIEFSSSKYDYVKIGDIKYEKENAEGNSQFFISAQFDYHMPIIANTTAMGNPHEIEYTLYFDSKSIVKR